MKKSRKSRQPSPTYRKKITAWYQDKKPILLFAAKFLGLVTFFSLLSLLPAYHRLQGFEAEWSARLAHYFLSIFPGGASTVSGGALYRGSEAILEVKLNCSALHYCWMLASAVLAYPAPWFYRLAGIIFGSLILLAANILRIVCLFLLGCYYPDWFPDVHEHYWPVVSLLLIVLVMGTWVIGTQTLLCQKK